MRDVAFVSDEVQAGVRYRAAADWGESDVGAVVSLEGLDVVEPVGEHPVEFAGEDGDVAGDDRLALS